MNATADELEDPRKFMEVEHRRPGYANVTISGRCGPDVTKEDVEARFYHSYFGGREAWVKDGRFGCVIHTD
jgi:hypothetical protein